MYSDNWIKISHIHKTAPIRLTDEISICYWMKNDSEIIGVNMDFNFANDYHYEFLAEDWELFLQKVLSVAIDSDYIPSLKAYFQKPSAHLDFMTAIWEHKIAHQKIAYY